MAVLSGGVLQQVDTPQALYREPSNTFVASFIGSPSMNFLRAKLVRGAIELGRFRLELPEAVRRRLLQRARRRSARLAAGALLRRASGRDAGTAGDHRDTEVIEQLGPGDDCVLPDRGGRVGGDRERPVELSGALAARLDPRTSAAAGELIDLAADLEGAQLFDPATGESLLARTTASP